FEFGFRIDDVRALVAADVVNPAVAQECRGVDAVGIGIEPFFVLEFSRFGIGTVNDAAVVAGPIQVAVVIYRRGDVGAALKGPEQVRLGDIAGAAGADRDGGIVAGADGEDDAVMGGHARANVIRQAYTIPQFLAGLRIEGEQAIFNADDDF